MPKRQRVFKILLMIVFIALFSSCSRRYSPPVSNRVRTSIDFNWKFFKGNIKGAENVSFNDASWRDVKLPHDWSIEGPFSKNNPSGGEGGYLPGGIGWYRKHFNLPEEDKGKKVFIEFDGVYMNSKVWINNVYLGNHPYGYTSFSYDLTPYLNYGDKENILAVKVDNSKQPNSRWYSGSGIYRHVWLVTTDKLHIAHWGTYITTPEVSKKSATIEIKTRVKNEYDVLKKVVLITSIVDKNDRELKEVKTAHDIPGNGECEFVQSCKIRSPNLWSPDNPYLYRVYTKIEETEEVVDNYKTPMGIREFYFDANKGFFLNGENIKIKGTCNHHDCGLLGAACPDRANERKVEIMREMGCNAIRMSHNPPSPELLDYCDKYGILVMDEAFDEWKRGKLRYGYHEYFDKWATEDLKSMIYRDRNHPSIILWSVGNEIPEQGRPEGVEILKKLVEVVHKEDPTRPVTSACNYIQGANKTGFAGLLDVVGYNYSERFYEEDHKKYPERKIIATETVNYPYQPGNAFPYRSYSQWLKAQKSEYVIGEFLWTGFDYLGESGIGEDARKGPNPWEECPKWPCRSALCGFLDLCGFKKPGYYFRRSLWSDTPMVYLVAQNAKDAKNIKLVPFWGWPEVASHWNWKEDTIFVHCYTNCESVELLLNGKSLGSKELSPSRPFLMWKVHYEPGELKAVGKRNDKGICTHELYTAGKPAKIVLTPDRESIVADGQDISFITVNILDNKGTIAPRAKNLITFNISGEGEIIGVGSGDSRSHEDYKSNKRKAYNGKCLVIIQSKRNPGQILLTATSPGLSSDSITVNSRP